MGEESPGPFLGSGPSVSSPPLSQEGGSGWVEEGALSGPLAGGERLSGNLGAGCASPLGCDIQKMGNEEFPSTALIEKA